MKKDKKRKELNIRIIGIVAVVFIVLGLFLTVKGGIIQYHLQSILTEFFPGSVSYGQYIQTDITQYLGSYSTFPGQEERFYPVSITEVLPNWYTLAKDIYLVAAPPQNEFYFCMYVSGRFIDEANDFFYHKGGSSYPLTGKIVPLSQPLPYDAITKVTRLTDTEEIHSLVSPDYAVTVVDINQEKRVLPSGICLLLAGLILLIFMEPFSVIRYDERI